MCSPQTLRLSLHSVSLKSRGLWVLHILFLEIQLTTGLKKKKKGCNDNFILPGEEFVTCACRALYFCEIRWDALLFLSEHRALRCLIETVSLFRNHAQVHRKRSEARSYYSLTTQFIQSADLENMMEWGGKRRIADPMPSPSGNKPLCLVAQSCPTLCEPMDCSPPDSSVHGILQARIMEWVVMPSSRGSSQPRD